MPKIGIQKFFQQILYVLSPYLGGINRWIDIYGQFTLSMKSKKNHKSAEWHLKMIIEKKLFYVMQRTSLRTRAYTEFWRFSNPKWSVCQKIAQGQGNCSIFFRFLNQFLCPLRGVHGYLEKCAQLSAITAIFSAYRTFRVRKFPKFGTSYSEQF